MLIPNPLLLIIVSEIERTFCPYAQIIPAYWKD